MMNPITVLISDDHTIVRAALRILLEAAGDIIVVGEATNGQQAVAEAKRLQPHVTLMDLGMPLMNGVEAARQIVNGVPFTRVLVLSGYTDEQHVLQAIQAGVTGYLFKSTCSNNLLRAIREVAQGNAFITPSISQRVLTKLRTALDDNQDLDQNGNSLTSRQAEVLQLIAEGYMTKQIAGMLSLSIKTVEKHRQSLMNRLDLHKIADLTRFAVSNGVIESRINNMAA
jgi:DNA-binding NarL/FixJ family response regulator